MKKILIIALLNIAGIIIAYGKYNAPNASFSLNSINGKYERGDIQVKQVITSDDSITINTERQIDGLAISGMVIQDHPNSFVRVLLKDNDGKEYVVLETCRLYNDYDTLFLSGYCEETMVLDHISPSKLLIYLSDACIDIESTNLLYSQANNKKGNKESDNKSSDYRRTQREVIVNRINDYNATHNRLWRAGVTDISLLPWESQKRLLGIDGSCKPSGFEYYTSGIFEFGNVQSDSLGYRSSRYLSPYIDHFDWRNRHGINWMTPVKNQSDGSGCWAFGVIGVTEALVNLYFNQKIDYDLAEQEVISCSDAGTNLDGGISSLALQWVADNGVSEEASFPFSNSDEACDNKGPFNERISFYGKNFVNHFRINDNDSVKKALIKYGPLLSGVTYRTHQTTSHIMVIAGYATIHAGDTIRLFNNYNQAPYNYIIPENDERIGKTYWIFKNSYGVNSGHQGYMYALFNDQNCFIIPYFAVTPVYSLAYSDSDILITDADGDGYYSWGIGTRPSHCPSWIPEQQDGDDSDYSKGPMNEFGYIYDLSSHVNDCVYINSDTTWNQKRFIYNNIIIPTGVTLTITDDVVFYNGARITLTGGTLRVNGGNLQNATVNIVEMSGSNVIVDNDGSINNAVGNSFNVPNGTTMEINYGTINN